ncbi:MAG: HEAT repeat domain-containing protein, partial [Anaerolineae bacterium]
MRRRSRILLVIGGLLLAMSVVCLIGGLLNTENVDDFAAFLYCPLSGMIVGAGAIIFGRRMAPPPDVDELRSNGNVRGLVMALKYKKDAEVRQAAAAALGGMANADAVQTLTAALEDDVPAVRRAAARALGRIGDARAADGLVKALCDDELRETAIDALARVGTPSVEALTTCLEDGDPEVRATAAELLGKTGDDRAVEPLTVHLEDEIASVRRAAAEALGTLGDTRAMDSLIELLADDSASVRRAACHALGKLGDRGAVEPLITALEDADATVRQAAAQALQEMEDRRVVEPLIAALGDSDRAVRLAA